MTISILGRISAAARAFTSPVPMATRSYEGASAGRRWPAGQSSMPNPARSASSDRHTIAARASFLAANNAIAARAIALLVSNSVGPGIVGRPIHSDTRQRDRLLAAFNQFAAEVDFDNAGDLYALQASLARDLFTTGEALAAWISTPAGWKLRRLPSGQIDAAKMARTAAGGQIDAGCEYLADGRLTALWLRTGEAADPLSSFSPSVRVPAENLIFAYRRDHPGQRRGVSALAPALLSILDYDAWADATLTRAKVAALLGGFVHDDAPAEDPDIFPGQQSPDSDGAALASLEPGSLQILPPGKRISFSDPPSTNDFSSFGPQVLRLIASATGVPYCSLASNFGDVNYSSARAEMLEFRRLIEQVQHSVLIPQICAPVWRKFLRQEILRGRVSAAAVDANRDLFACRWTPPRWEQVDPEKATKAAILQVDNLFRSRASVAAEFGEDVESIDAEIAADQAREERLGLTRRTVKAIADTTENEDNADANSNA
ncbi:MAG: phage portal protein [Pseudomonadota bacterium]|nr:phage portal protein [Pseudomonadota bacterium]